MYTSYPLFTVIYLYLHKCLLYTGKERRKERYGCTCVHEYQKGEYEFVRVPPNRQRDLEGTSTIRGSTSRYKGCTSLYEYHPSLPKSQREGTSKGAGRYEKEGYGRVRVKWLP